MGVSYFILQEMRVFSQLATFSRQVPILFDHDVRQGASACFTAILYKSNASEFFSAKKSWPRVFPPTSIMSNCQRSTQYKNLAGCPRFMPGDLEKYSLYFFVKEAQEGLNHDDWWKMKPRRGQSLS
jgi:hypothetical protein